MTPRSRYYYLLSLPERVLRSLGALSGGLLREIGTVALPVAVRRTALYRNMVDVALRFLIEEVGQVEGVYPSEGRLAENFLLKRTASHGIELLGILAFHASPIWVLAALADASGGGRKLIQEMSQGLKEEGLLDSEASFESMEDVLDGLEKASSHLADTLNIPPIDVPGLRREWERLREELKQIPPKNLPTLSSLEHLWAGLQDSARQQGRSVFTVSSLMAISTIRHLPGGVLWLSKVARSAARTTGNVLDHSILDHYSRTLAEISSTGFAEYWSREFHPYLRAAAQQFAPGRESLTGRLLRKKNRRPINADERR